MKIDFVLSGLNLEINIQKKTAEKCRFYGYCF